MPDALNAQLARIRIFHLKGRNIFRPFSSDTILLHLHRHDIPQTISLESDLCITGLLLGGDGKYCLTISICNCF